jgi:hypothetical protein
VEAGSRVLDKTVGTDHRGHTTEGDQPPRKSLSSEKEIFGGSCEPGKDGAESEDGNEIENDNPEIDAGPDNCGWFHLDRSFGRKMPEKLKNQVKKKPSNHEKQSSSVFLFLPGVIFGPPGENNPQEKNDSTNHEVINE